MCDIENSMIIPQTGYVCSMQELESLPNTRYIIDALTDGQLIEESVLRMMFAAGFSIRVHYGETCIESAVFEKTTDFLAVTIALSHYPRGSRELLVQTLDPTVTITLTGPGGTSIHLRENVQMNWINAMHVAASALVAAEVWCETVAGQEQEGDANDDM